MRLWSCEVIHSKNLLKQESSQTPQHHKISFFSQFNHQHIPAHFRGGPPLLLTLGLLHAVEQGRTTCTGRVRGGPKGWVTRPAHLEAHICATVWKDPVVYGQAGRQAGRQSGVLDAECPSSLLRGGRWEEAETPQQQQLHPTQPL
ncbi:hypothetical protein ATANTOWER_002721 [Ataeniobius toweri]|uniref:Uncharacterized protein n=1 Tax=Ataeniobius toweri TaxID=208326 RepID=A0ABU7BVK8_9TELE|nr:hypothetical protein [Ataeniobius toweri]